MKLHEIRRMQEIVENEGFTYAFTDYSHYEEIEDETFHRLRMMFLNSRIALANYIGVELEDIG